MVSVSIVIPVYRDTEALARTLAATDCPAPSSSSSRRADDQTLTPLRLARRTPHLARGPAGTCPADECRRGRRARRVAAVSYMRTAGCRTAGARRSTKRTAAGRFVAGCYRFALDSRSPLARVIELGVRLRVALLGLPYGDQALFVRRERFEAVGGFTDLPIMEDVDFVRRIHREGSAFPLPAPRRHVGAALGARRLGQPDAPAPLSDLSVLLRRPARSGWFGSTGPGQARAPSGTSSAAYVLIIRGIARRNRRRSSGVQKAELIC